MLCRSVDQGFNTHFRNRLLAKGTGISMAYAYRIFRS